MRPYIHQRLHECKMNILALFYSQKQSQEGDKLPYSLFLQNIHVETVQFTLNTTPKYFNTSSNTPSAHKYTLPHSQLECLSSDFKNLSTCYDLATCCLHKYLAKINTKNII